MPLVLVTQPAAGRVGALDRGDVVAAVAIHVARVPVARLRRIDAAVEAVAPADQAPARVAGEPLRAVVLRAGEQDAVDLWVMDERVVLQVREAAVARGPGRSAIGREPDAAVVAEPDAARVGAVERQRVLVRVGAGRGRRQVGPRHSGVGAAPDPGLAEIDRVGRRRMDGEDDVVVRLAERAKRRGRRRQGRS